MLALPSFRAAGARVACGDPEARQVRWIHSSEVFEMGALLAGGELLLTTGLGLHGRSQAQLEEYIDALADAGCVGLCLELGRSLLTLPEALLRAAERRSLLLVVMDRVVPFERMVEDFHHMVLHRQLGSTRVGEAAWRDLLAVVLSGEGLRALLDTVSRLVGCEVEFRDTDDRLVERSRIVSTRGTDTVAVEVRGRSGPRGTLLLHTPSTRRVRALAEPVATAVGLELTRQPDIGLRPTLAQSLVTDLGAGVLVAGEDVGRRLEEAGMPWTAPSQLVVACGDAGHRVPVDEVVLALRGVFAARGNAVLAGAVGHQVVVLIRTSRLATGRARAFAQECFELVGRALPGEARVVLGVVPGVTDPAALSAAVARARETVRLAHGYGVHSGVLLARDVGVQRLLGTGVPTGELADFVREQLGPLIDHDRAHASDLVRTLDAFLASGLSKSGSAAQLGIRRQSLYARLQRIEQLLGISFADPGHVGGVTLALTAWRMRTGLDPQVAFARSAASERATHRPIS